tara:strand:- start:570 stop:974 length:405 start_codon:yes stop_codon:yes gene_type:complete
MENVGVFDDSSQWRKKSWVSHRIADCIFAIHMFITLFCGFAWLGPHDWMLIGVLIIYGSIELMWYFRDSFCILTDLERGLRGVPKPDSVLDQNFIRRVVKLLFRVDLEPRALILFTRSWGRFGFIVAFSRLFLF